MKISKIIIISLSLMIASTSLFAQNISQDMLQKAKLLGISEQQIKQEFSKHTKSSSNSSKLMVNSSDSESIGLRVSDTLNVTDISLQNLAMQELTSTELAVKELVARGQLILMKKQIDSLSQYDIYGQDLFSNSKITYEPNLNIPTPIDYVLSIGDEVIIDVWGDSQFSVKESISPEGIIHIPSLGPINISGMTMASAKQYIQSKLANANQSIGITSQVMLSIGQIRSIKVNVTGEVVTPGAYTVPSLATLFHALHMSGGTTDIGDLRNIEVFRKSKKVASADIYNFIMNGDISGNIILKDGDVIVVSPYKSKAYISGEIKRPMYYLMKDNESIGSIIEFAGSFKDNAYKSRVKVFRKGAEYNEIITVEKANFDKVIISNGDSIVVERAKDEFDNIINIEGAVWYPGDFQLDDKTNSLSKLIKYAGGLKGSAFAKSALIERRNSDYTKSIINFNPTDIVTGKSDIELLNYDRIVIPTVLSLQEKFTVSILGEVNTPDTISFREGMRIEDAIILAGGLKESASLSVISVSRRLNNNKSIEYTDRMSDVFLFAINQDLSLTDSTKNFTLKPFDIVIVRRSPQYKNQSTIIISGEVIIPGSYTIIDESTYLSDIVKIAKGTTPNAYIKGASMVRLSPDGHIAKSVKKLNQASTAADSLSISNEEISSFSVAINLEKALLAPRGKDDILLQKGDVITIPKFTNIVNTVGAVYYPNATIFKGHKLKQYIRESGGFTKQSRKRPYVIYKNGTVKSTRSIFFVRSYPKIEPGCLIVVPSKEAKEKMSFAEIIGIATSATSLATSVGTLGLSLAK